MEVRDYNPRNWFTNRGVRQMKASILAKGVPDMTDWRFITLTLNPDLFEDEVDGYFKGLERLRRFNSLMKGYFGDEFHIQHCWKMEFHSGAGLNHGWVHWHLSMSITRKLTHVEMAMISGFWGLGRVNIKRIEGPTLDYMFKYLFKNPDTNETVPDWFADYRGEDGKTFGRARFWQTSPHFYTGIDQRPDVKKKEPETCLMRETVRYKIERWQRCVVLTARTRNNGYITSRVTEIQSTKSKFFNHMTNLVLSGLAVEPFSKQYKTNSSAINKHIRKWQKNITSKDRQVVNRQATILQKLLKVSSNLSLERIPA